MEEEGVAPTEAVRCIDLLSREEERLCNYFVMSNLVMSYFVRGNFVMSNVVMGNFVVSNFGTSIFLMSNQGLNCIYFYETYSILSSLRN